MKFPSSAFEVGGIVMYVLIFVGILCIVLGVLVKCFKCYWLISGYNTMSKEKRKNVDTEGLGRLIGNFMFLLGVVMFLGAGLISTGFKTFGIILIVGAIFLLTPYIMIKSQKYDKNALKPDGSMKKSTKLMIGVFIGFTLIIFIFIIGLNVYGTQEPRVTVDDEKIKIDGMYASTVRIDDIIEVVLLDSIPEVLRKDNGFDFGNILRGKFSLESIGKGRLYINNGKSPYVYLRLKNGFVIINYNSSEKTQELYDKIEQYSNIYNQ